MAQVDFDSLLKNAMGLDTASIGSAAVERAVRLRMATLGLKQAHDYWQRLRGSTGELQELIEGVVVPETWFFRDREAFATLVCLVMEEWRPAPSGGGLRLINCPCSTGEGTQSLVMSLLDWRYFPPSRPERALGILA